MRFSSLIVPAIAVSVSAHDLHHNRHSHLHSKRADGPLITTGAKGLGDGKVHTRLEISDLAANRPEQWALFIQAMSKFQDAAPSNVTGFYSVASIHGVPRQDWDGVPQCDSCQGADGYCPHGLVLFPAWHRAYVALFEQELINFAYEAAYAYPEDKREAMLCAASSFRFPYWDWAASPDSNVLPNIISSPQVTYEGPNGQETVNNPLYTYELPDPSAMYYGPFIDWDTTLRWPDSNAANASSEDQSAVSTFNNIRDNIASQVYNLLTVCNDYLHFSNDAAGSGQTSCTNSIEGIHNTIHQMSGGPGGNGVSGGHMTYLPVAAFDPIFFLHHANVDRIFALWQAVNPTVFGADQVAQHSTWTVATGTTQGPDSPLEPFRKDENTFWTTNDVRYWDQTFGYTYPEFSTTDGSRASIIDAINSLYGSDSTYTESTISEKAEQDSCSSQSSASSSTSSSSTSSSSTSSALTSSTTSPAIQNAITTSSQSLTSTLQGTTSILQGTTSSSSKRTYTPTKTFLGSFTTGTAGSSNSSSGQGSASNGSSSWDYGCTITCPRNVNKGPYTVYVFGGQPASNDTSTYPTDKNLVGAIGVLGGGDHTPNISLAGDVPLTRYLQGQVQNGALSSMTKNATSAYLAQNLSWKIVQNGQEIHPDSISGFQASVYSAVSTKGQDQLPVWSAVQPVVEATKGKAGGLQSASGAIGQTPWYGNGQSGNSTSPVSAPSGSRVPSGAPAAPTSWSAPTASVAPSVAPAYTGAASKASFGVAGVLAIAGLAALL